MAMMEDKGKNGIGEHKHSVKIIAGEAFSRPAIEPAAQPSAGPEQHENESATNH